MLDLIRPMRFSRPATYERPVSSLRNEVDRLFDSVFPADSTTRCLAGPSPAAEVWEDADAIRVLVDVAGMEEKDIAVELQSNVLTIRGERRQEQQKNGANLHLSERWYGSFQKNIVLPAGVDAAQISATYTKGVLTIVMPKDASEKPRRISITSSK